MYLYENDIYAYGPASTETSLVSPTTGNVNIYGSGTMDLEDTYIYADRNVNVESGGKLALGLYSSGAIYTGETAPPAR